MITLTREAWGRFAPRCPPAWTDALFSSLELVRAAGLLDSELRWCHFAATVFAETGDFREIRESLRYTSCKALRSTWPSRFGHKSDDELLPLLKNERALAAAVYCGRMGNKTPDDAFDFRGGGFFQTTGREAVERYCTAIGIAPGPHVLDDPLITLKFALREWADARCNEWADENSLLKVAKAINTGSASSNVAPVGMDNRRAAFARAWKIWGETGTADAPLVSDDVRTAVRGAVLKYGAPAVGIAGGGAHLATKAGQDTTGAAPSPPPATKSVQDHLDAARQRMDQGKQAVAMAKEVGGMIPGVPKQYEGAGIILVLGLMLAVGVEMVMRRR